MGTSKAISTPKNGDWSRLKRTLTGAVSGSRPVPARDLAGQTVAAGGGFSAFSRPSGRGGGGGSGGGGGGSGPRQSTTRAAGRAAAGLGGFSSDVVSGGLEQALERLGLEDLRGKPAAEVIAQVADKLADIDGLEGDLLRSALRNAILEAAQLAAETGFDDLDAGLQEFVNTEGLEGLIGLFLTRFAYEYIVAVDHEHIAGMGTDNAGIATFEAGILYACRSEVRSTVEELKAAGRFENTDWFGAAGRKVGQDVAYAVEARFLRVGEEAVNP